MAAARGNHGDNQVGEGILEVLQRIAASLTHNQNGLRNVLAGGAVFEQVRAGAVDIVIKIQVGDGDLTGAEAATGVHGGFLMNIPAPAQYFNFIFVFVIH